MNINTILADPRAERDRIDRAISALGAVSGFLGFGDFSINLIVPRGDSNPAGLGQRDAKFSNGEYQNAKHSPTAPKKSRPQPCQRQGTLCPPASQWG
jgi:hypothetical protein